MSDSEDEKGIKKAQERALKQKKQNAFKRTEKAKNSFNAPSSRSGDDRRLFRGMLIALSLIFSVAGNCSHSACLIVCVYLYASAFWRRKIVFLQTNVVREKESDLS